MIKRIFKTILNEIKINPEWVAIPLVVISYILIQRMLYWNAQANGLISDDVIQFFVLAAFGLLLGNFLAHLGIKFNHPIIWKQYKASIKDGVAPPKDYYYYLVSYLLVYALTLIAIFP
jgi:hypothetical protein